MDEREVKINVLFQGCKSAREWMMLLPVHAPFNFAVVQELNLAMEAVIGPEKMIQYLDGERMDRFGD